VDWTDPRRHQRALGAFEPKQLLAELMARKSAQPVHARFLTALAVGLGAITLGQLVVASGVLGIDELVRRQQVFFACYLVSCHAVS